MDPLQPRAIGRDVLRPDLADLEIAFGQGVKRELPKTMGAGHLPDWAALIENELAFVIIPKYGGTTSSTVFPGIVIGFDDHLVNL